MINHPFEFHSYTTYVLFCSLFVLVLLSGNSCFLIECKGGALNLGNKPETLWKLYEVLPKLFDHMPKSAKTAFEAVLGKQQISDDQFEQEQKYKWS